MEAEQAYYEDVEWQNQFMHACSSAPWAPMQTFMCDDVKDAQFNQTQKICAMISSVNAALKTCFVDLSGK
eukprot:9828644-Karenia_brevis.AAC.1